MTSAVPSAAGALTIELLDELIHSLHPEVSVKDFAVRDTYLFGDGTSHVSTAGRITLDVTYDRGPAAADLPKQILLKVNRPDIQAHPLYRNEVAFYTRIRPELGGDIEVPRCIGGLYDKASRTFGLALEDLTARGARFPSVKTLITIPQMQSLLDSAAALHGRYWDSPRYATDLAWVQSHTEGELHNVFNLPGPVPAIIEAEIANNQFKRELVYSIGETADSLYAHVRRVQAHQATLPRTQVHGDLHIGNAYVLPDDRGGLVDWQLTVRGHCMHDVAYLLVTGLTVEQRRQHERDLLDYYRDRLHSAGVVHALDRDTLWLEYRRAVVWGVYIGWLVTPIQNYGWEICVVNHIRLMSAYRDLETARALADLPEA